MLTCKQCAEILPDLLEDNCDPVLKAQLLLQASAREKCKQCVDGYVVSAKLARHAFVHKEQPNTCEHLLSFLRQNLHLH